MDSLLLYLSSFACSSGAAYIYQIKYKTGCDPSIYKKLMWAVIIMFFPMIISCYRYGIGIDYENYIILFEEFHSSTWNSLVAETLSFEYINKAIVDLGFLLTGNTNGVFAIYAIMTLIMFELSLINFKSQISLPVSTFILLLLMYSLSLNIIRQALALSIIFYSLKFIVEKRPIGYFIGCIIATGIHTSAVISILFYFLYEHKNTLYKTLLNRAIKIGVIILPIILTPLLNNFQTFFLFKNYFENYEQEGASIVESYIIKLPILIILMLNYRYLKGSNISRFLYWMFALELIMLFVASIYKWAFRLSYYSYIGQVLLVGIIARRRTSDATIYKLLLITYYIIYFYVLFYMWGRDGIFPYTRL